MFQSNDDESNSTGCDSGEPSWLAEQCKQLQVNQVKSKGKLTQDVLTHRQEKLKKLKEGSCSTERNKYRSLLKRKVGIDTSYAVPICEYLGCIRVVFYLMPPDHRVGSTGL